MQAILSCRCTYWANLFASGMKESREEVLEVADLSATGLRLILTYLYTDNCVVRIRSNFYDMPFSRYH